MRSAFFLSLLTTLLYAIHGTLLGPSDDEAYYWVLSHQWNLGFAYHPPLVVWLIGLSREVFGIFLPENHSFILRMPAFICIFLIFFYSLRFVSEAPDRKLKNLKWSWITILSFVGLSSAIWMVVPDLPLFVGFVMAFYHCHRWLRKQNSGDLIGFWFGIVIALMSKFSAVLIPLSAVLSVFILGKTISKSNKASFLFILVLGCFAGLLPTLLWNLQNDFGPILYQLQGRHSGGAFQFSRWIGFWAVQTLLLGPPMMFFLFQTLKRRRHSKTNRKLTEYAILWSIPALFVFGIQPFFSPFKLHWIFIAFYPIVLELAVLVAKNQAPSYIRSQWVYGLSLGLVFLISCHYPLQSTLMSVFQENVNPKWDVTNDLYGWEGLPKRVPKDMKVIGSRYQTASQAAFAIGDVNRVGLLPLQEKEMKDWVDLDVTRSRGPGWSKLTEKVIYVADHRYTMGPQFNSQTCRRLKNLVHNRGQFKAREVMLWECR